MSKHSIRQSGVMNCGAACLLCAALELDKAPTPESVAHLPKDNGLRALTEASWPFKDSDFWQDAIYKISGAGLDGYSLPSGILAAASALGLTAKVITAQTFSMKLLGWNYPQELVACGDAVERRASSNLGDLDLQRHQRAMHCVRLGLAFHWVLQRPDHTYMDPANANERVDRATMKQAAQGTGRYHGTGLAILLS